MKSVYMNENHDIFRQSVRQFIEKEVAPHANEWEENRCIPKAIWQRMGELGFLGILFPETLGGSGVDIFYSMIFLEEIARSKMGGFCAAVSAQEFISTGALYQQGSDELKELYLKTSIHGTHVGAIAISEPNTGSDVAAIQTTAIKDGNEWVINGSKTWITNGVYADFYVVACKTNKEEGAGGISLIVVKGKTPGLEAKKLKKMGWHSSDTAELFFDQVRTPLSHLIGEENMGFYYIMQTFVMERLSVAGVCIGAAVVALEDTLAYMESRHAFGKSINRFQALRHRLADLFAELESVRQLTYHAAWLHEQGEHAVRESSMAKLMASEFLNKVVSECVQFHGGFGYVEEYPIARAYRDAKVCSIVAGTSEIMREIIAKTDIDKIDFSAFKRRI